MPGDRWQQLANLRALYGFMWAHPGKKLLFMGCEFAQSQEWNSSQSLDWHLTQYQEHQQIQATVAELNAQYKGLPELWQRDITPEGFQWLVVDDGAANVVAFARFAHDGRPLVSVTNFSPVPHLHYTLPLPGNYSWKLILNTDDQKFGGSGVAPTDIQTISSEYKGLPSHAVVAVPPLATIWLTPQ
jgi:1,4-alpha-glucan branching enzyme